MPEPRGPQEGQQNQDLDTPKQGSEIAPDAQKQSQSKPGDRDRYADPDKRAQDQEDHQDDRDALENEIEDDEQAGKEQTEKQSGQMLENPPSAPERDQQ